MYPIQELSNLERQNTLTRYQYILLSQDYEKKMYGEIEWVGDGTLWRFIRTLLVQKSPQALQRVLGPEGPRRIIGVQLELMPQWVHLRA